MKKVEPGRMGRSIAMRLGLPLLIIAASTCGIASRARADTPSPPKTTEEHAAAAKSYRDQADGARRSAETHRTMIDAALSRKKDRRERRPGESERPERQDQWYIDHCRKLIKQANELASTAMALAEYHEKKAAEMKTAPAP